jgi:hypothetical protein
VSLLINNVTIASSTFTINNPDGTSIVSQIVVSTNGYGARDIEERWG